MSRRAPARRVPEPTFTPIDERTLAAVTGGAINWRYYATQAMLNVASWNPAMVGVW